MYTTIKYLRRAAGIGLGTTINYLRHTTSAAANNALGTTAMYLVNQNAGAGTTGPRPTIHKSCSRIQITPPPVVYCSGCVNSEPHTRELSVYVWGE
jgi:hypothetical protein